MSAAEGGGRERLDQRLVSLGLAESRSRAQALVKAGAVRVDGAVVEKPSATPPATAEIVVAGDPNPWVSRGGLKLAFALECFEISVQGLEALDVGASTGGFAEVCLARGAARVTAVDVGRGQLHPKLAADPRVVDLSPLHARELTGSALPAPPDLVVADISFISLAKALPVPLSLTAPEAALVALVKPQFEVGPERVGKGGIVRDVEAQEEAVQQVWWFLDDIGWRPAGQVDSPILGADGNREILIAARRGFR